MAAAARGPVRTVVAGVDGSEGSLRAVRWAAAEAARRDAPLLLVYATSIASLYVAPSAAPLFGDVEAKIDQEAERVLAEARAAAEAAGAGDVRTHADENAPALALRDASRNARLLVLGAAGRGRLGTALGSVTLTVASHAECPVVVVRGEDRDGPVVVGVDGGPLSGTALAHAFDEAAVRGSGLSAVHVWNDSDVGRAHLAHYFELEPWERTRDVEERALAERLAGWSERYPDVPVERRVEQDDPAASLVAASAGAALVVVATRGRGGFAGLLLGSTGLALAQNADCPVLLVGPESAPLP